MLDCLKALSLVLIAVVATSCDQDGESGSDAFLFDLSNEAALPDVCPNSVAADEHCPDKCFKERGTGISYCADTCALDGDCSGKAHAWLPAAGLVCHQQDKYCTRRCAVDQDCHIGKYTEELRCDTQLQVCSSCMGDSCLN